MNRCIYFLLLFSTHLLPADLFDYGLIQPYSGRVLSKIPYSSPYIATYNKGNNTFIMIATHHASSLTSSTHKTIEYAIREFSPQVIILEGISYDRDFNMRKYISKAKEESKTGFEHCSESIYAAYLASQNSIPFYGGEPSHLHIYEELLREGYTSDDFFGFYCIRQIPQWTLEKKAVNKERVEDFIELFCKIMGVKSTMNYSKLFSWYQERMGKTLVPSRISSEETRPMEQSKSFMQRIAYKATKLRDIQLLKTTEELMDRYNRVLAIYGSSHHAVNLPALEAVLGKPIYSKPY
jgi:hypothetical protein